MYTIYHNPRCTKSRETLALLEESGVIFEIKEYLDGITTEEMNNILSLLGVDLIDIMRTGEDAWKESGLSKDSTDDQIMDVLLENPILLERPIVLKDYESGIIGRPPENLQKIL